jgi:hypothetical protein
MTQRAIHRPITIHVEVVEDLPTVKTLPQDTQMTINLKMNRATALGLIAKIQSQLDIPGEVDFVAFTITGRS